MSKRGVKDPVTGITDGAMRTLLKSVLRPCWRRTSRRTFIESVRYKATNPKTGREWFAVDCCDCGRVMGCSEKERRPLVKGGLSKSARSVFEIDHVDGITPLTDIKETLGLFFDSLIYGKQEVVCVKCHALRTAKQTKERNLTKQTKKQNKK